MAIWQRSELARFGEVQMPLQLASSNYVSQCIIMSCNCEAAAFAGFVLCNIATWNSSKKLLDFRLTDIINGVLELRRVV